MTDETKVIEGETPVTQDAQADPKPVEITEDQIKAHPLFQKTLTESIERRKTIQELRKQLSDLSKQGDDPEEAPKTPAKSETPKQETPEEIAQRVAAILRSETERQRQAEQDRQSVIAKLIEKHGLPDTARAVLEPIQDGAVLEQVAAGLTKANLRFDRVDGGGSTLNVDEIATRMKQRLGLVGK